MNTYVYTNFKKNLGSKMEDVATDTLKVGLFASSYAPNVDSDCAYHMTQPASPTLIPAGTGGTVLAGTYQVEITYVNPAGESLASTSSSVTTSGSTSTITIDSPSTPSPLCSCSGWYAYVTQAGGSSYTRQQTLGSPTALGTNLVLTAPPSSGGAAPPGSSTADIFADEVATGGGYSAGGIALSSVTWSEVLANSFTRSWAGSTAYSIGQIVRPSTGNGWLYMCVGAGSSGASAPSWGTTFNGLTTDGTVTWLNIGSSIVVLSAANITWTVSSAITWRYGVVYDSTTGDLIAYLDPGSSQTGPSSGTINFDWDSAAGVLVAA